MSATFGTDPEQVQAIIAGGPAAIVSAGEGAEDDADAGRRAIEERAVGPADAVVGIAASGRTPFVLGAVARARQVGALTVGLSCNPGSSLAAAVEFPIEITTGPEVLAGSTRLKAGTAQKLVLNMISTISMVRLGRTYGNLMVDMRATNAKLRERAVRIVGEVTGARRARVEAALQATGFEVKPAVVMVERGVGVDEARRRLAEAGGRLRAALEIHE